jgi:hypothetical protein
MTTYCTECGRPCDLATATEYEGNATLPAALFCASCELRAEKGTDLPDAATQNVQTERAADPQDGQADLQQQLYSGLYPELVADQRELFPDAIHQKGKPKDKPRYPDLPGQQTLFEEHLP